MGTSLTMLRLFFHKVCFIINTLFPYFLETLYAGRIKIFAEASEFFSCAVFQLVVLRKTLFGVHPSGDQKDGSRGELNRSYREMRKNKINV